MIVEPRCPNIIDGVERWDLQQRGSVDRVKGEDRELWQAWRKLETKKEVLRE